MIFLKGGPKDKNKNLTERKPENNSILIFETFST